MKPMHVAEAHRAGALAGPEVGRPFSGEEPVKLSILMPVYNEERTVASVARALLACDYPCEIELIIVDDGSSDRTPLLIAQLCDERVKSYRHPRNFGKGSALLTAAQLATGTHILPFDADLEYVASDIPRLLAPVLEGRCDVVYGSRLFGVNTVYQSYRYAMGNKLTTLAANLLFDAHLSDLHTCLKLVPLGLFHSLRLRSAGFGLDTEMTAGLLRLGIRPFEVPVTYHSRSHAEGKKLTWHDGVGCLAILGRVRFARVPRTTGEPAAEPAAGAAALREARSVALGGHPGEPASTGAA
ncbi:glycosyltransferase involved in cell wall biosynthesis [Kitasatospora sp. MAA4]|nr:glycosyltransferase involved in cell wall biosynthesis [Kitasatospora sp. MAA4]